MACLSVLVAAVRKVEGSAMVTTVDDPSQNGTQEEGNRSGQPGMEGPPAVQSSQEAETSGGEEWKWVRDVYRM